MAEAGLKQAALLTSAGVGLIDDLENEAVARRITDKTVSSQKQNLQVYKSALQEYCRIYHHMLGFWQAQ